MPTTTATRVRAPLRYLVTLHDPDGLPRAWGCAPTEAAATREAERQLEAYRARKRAACDLYLATATYSPRVARIP